MRGQDYGRRIWILAECEHGHITATTDEAISECVVCGSWRLDDPPPNRSIGAAAWIFRSEA